MSLRHGVSVTCFALATAVGGAALAQQSVTSTHTASEFYALPSDAVATEVYGLPSTGHVGRSLRGRRAFAEAAAADDVERSGQRRRAPATPPPAQDTPAAAPVPPPPTPEETRARTLFERGVSLADQLQWAEAADAFEDSYRASPRPVTLRNMGLAHRALGRYTQAIDELTRFLNEAGPSPDVRTQVAQLITDMRGQLAVVTLNPAVAGATLTLDNRTVHANEEITLDPGTHVVSATAAGYTHGAQTFTVQRAQHLAVSVRLDRAGGNGGILSQWWLWTGVGVVVAGGVVLSVFLLSHEDAPNCGTLQQCIMPH